MAIVQSGFMGIGRLDESQSSIDEDGHNDDAPSVKTRKESSSTDGEAERPEATESGKKQFAPFFITRALTALLPRRWIDNLDCSKDLQGTPSHSSAVFNYLFFSTSFRLVWTSALGYQREPNQFPPLPAQRNVTARITALEAALSRNLHKSQCARRRWPLLGALWAVFRPQVLEGLLCNALYVCASMFGVLLYKVLLEYLVKFYHHHGPVPGHSFAEGSGYVIALASIRVFEAVLRTRGFYAHSMAGAEMSTLCSAAITQKSLRIKPGARPPQKGNKSRGLLAQFASEDAETPDDHEPWTTGAVLNMVNTDSARIQTAMKEFNGAWSVLLAYPIVLGLSYWLIGWPGPASFAIAPVMLIFIVWLMKSLGRLRRQINITTDLRVSQVNDLVTGIRLLKAYSWEKLSATALAKVRRREGKLNRARVRRNGLVAVLAETTGRGPPVIGVAIFASVVGVGLLESPEVLVFVALFYKVGMFAFMVPEAAVYLIDAWLSIVRLQDYLLAEEFEGHIEISEAPDETTINGHRDSSTHAILATNAEFSWTGSHVPTSTETSEKSQTHTDTFDLRAFSLAIRQNELIAITGTVGSGKSSLSAAISGAMPFVQGHIKRSTSPIYAPSVPWLYSTSLRENIIFGLPFDEACYLRVVSACGLALDFQRMQAGDRTVVGEKGLSLSGGQRSRVGLARAAYHALQSCSVDHVQSQDKNGTDRDLHEVRDDHANSIIVMDDPLSALDAKTSQFVFEHVILGLLTQSTRIIVSNQRNILKLTDRIVWMDNGVISDVDTFASLHERNGDFRDFLGHDSDTHKTTDATSAAVEPTVEAVLAIHQGDEVMVDEETHTHSVPWKLYASYINFQRTWPYVLLLLVVFAAAQAGNVLWGILFAWWTGQAYPLTNAQWIGIVATTYVMQLILLLTTSNAVQHALTLCSERASAQAMDGVLKAPVSFFDTTPIGRVINRFTSDVNTLDTILPLKTFSFVRSIFQVIAIVGFTAYYVPLVATIIVPWILIAAGLTLFYRPAPLAIKRVEAHLSSNVLACISEMVSGASTLRLAPAATALFMQRLRAHIDALNRVHFTSYACHGWMTIRSEGLSSIFYIATGLFGLMLRRSVLPGVIVILLTACVDIMRCIEELLDAVVEVQRGLNCIERLDFYANHIGEERQHTICKDLDPAWPRRGDVQMRNVQLRYRPGLPAAIRHLNMTISGGQKIGIVGRTGAGKSTVLAALLGFMDPDKGKITIDDIDITTLDVRRLREALAVIPQEPTLFGGTVRTNLDPEGVHDDAQLLTALEQVGLRDGDVIDEKSPSSPASSAGPSRSLQLDTRVSAGGTNLSTGQRQLLALARAVVRDRRVILIDEATAGVDAQLDARIQAVLRAAFADRTVVTIAHRVHTVKDYDRIAVLERGRLVEFGPPAELWRRADGHFRELCDRSGLTQEDFAG